LVAFFVNDVVPDPHVIPIEGSNGLPIAYRSIPELVDREDPNDSLGLKRQISRWLRARSMLYVLVRNRLDNMRARRLRARRLDAGKARQPEQEASPGVYFRSAFRAESQDVTPQEWARTYRILDELKRLVTSHGSSLAMILIPAPWQTTVEGWEQWARNSGDEPSSLSRFAPQHRLTVWCQRTQTPCEDLFHVFNGVDHGKLFIQYDLHWNPAGHRLAALAVEDFLSTNHLLR